MHVNLRLAHSWISFSNTVETIPCLWLKFSTFVMSQLASRESMWDKRFSSITHDQVETESMKRHQCDRHKLPNSVTSMQLALPPTIRRLAGFDLSLTAEWAFSLVSTKKKVSRSMCPFKKTRWCLNIARQSCLSKLLAKHRESTFGSLNWPLMSRVDIRSLVYHSVPFYTVAYYTIGTIRRVLGRPTRSILRKAQAQLEAKRQRESCHPRPESMYKADKKMNYCTRTSSFFFLLLLLRDWVEPQLKTE